MLKQHALTATVWSGAEVALRQVLQLVLTIILARMLAPSDFGTVALLVAFSSTASVLYDGGFSVALIQQRGVDHVDESTVFWCNLSIGAAVSLILFAAAPLVASFYRLPILKSLTYIMSLTVLVSAAGAIHTTLLSKALDFRTQMKASLLATLASGITALLMAWEGYGVWALAIPPLLSAGIKTSMLWSFNSWRPAFRFSPASVRKLFGFGGYHLASALLESIYSRLYTVLIGKWYDTRQLGFYNNADTTKQVPSDLLTTVLARVAFPMFSSATHDKASLRRGMQLSIRGMMLFNAPIMFGGAVLAESIIQCLFGAQWLPAAPIFQVLCIGAVLFPLHMINVQILLALGHSRLLFRIEVAKKAIGIVLIVAGACSGIMGIAWSQVIFSIIALWINVHFTRQFLGYGAAAQVRDFAPVLSVAAAMASVLYFVKGYWSSASLFGLAVSIALGTLLFFGVAWLVRLDALIEVLILFRQHSAARIEASP